jgi:hypothetical protein
VLLEREARPWEDGGTQEDDHMTEPTSKYDPTSGPQYEDVGPDPDAASTGRRGSVDAGAILEQIREVVDDLAERAGPTVKQVSAKAAEVIATAADRAAPLAQRAGEVTAEASGKLSEKSRTWASEVRDQLGGDGGTGAAGGPIGTATSPGSGAGTTTSAGATGGPEFPGSAPADAPVADASTDTISNG